MTRYHGGKDSLYDILGLYRNCSPKDVEHAYQRLKAAAEKDAAPPAQLALLREAHEVLSNPQKRAAYDASLRSDEFLHPEGPRVSPGLKWGPIAAVAAAIVAGLWFLLQGKGESDRIPAEIVAAAAPAVGRTNVIDIRGKATPYDNAFAIDNGVMLTTCQGFRANTQAVVKFGARTASANVTRSDPKRNLCRLAVQGAGGFPLTINTTPPESGDKAYAVSTSAGGETVLVAVKIKGIVTGDAGRAIELADPVDPTQAGGPLLDTKGRVIGVMATQHPFAGKNVALPASWVQEIRAAPAR
ncbi:MAG TPA: trypsin-like peptidase domain-containing protein [Usitatibacter sp.]|nr:trypsin-like peptidase domain-containing protein [Usitatibacter sp.]